LGLGAAASGGAEFPVVAGGLVLVAVMDDRREEGCGEDAGRRAERHESQELDGSEGVVEPEVGPERDDGVPVGVPAAGEDDQAGEGAADHQCRPAPPAAILDGHAEGGGDDEGGEAHGDGDDRHGGEDHELEQVEVGFNGSSVRGPVHGAP
jgi:hypothetical protein